MHVHVVMYVIRRTRLCYLPFKPPFRLFGGNEIIAVLFFFPSFFPFSFYFLSLSLCLCFSLLSFHSFPSLFYFTTPPKIGVADGQTWRTHPHRSAIAQAGLPTTNLSTPAVQSTSGNCILLSTPLSSTFFFFSLDHRFLCGPARAATNSAALLHDPI